MNPPSRQQEAFDQYASNYDDALQQGIRLSGENKLYFAERRIEWLASRLKREGQEVRSVLDFGCGTGSATPYFFRFLGAEKVTGVDSSGSSIAKARSDHSVHAAEFFTPGDIVPSGQFDLAFCNGVFHHIPPAQRLDALGYIHAALRPGGWFALWENNPLNPGTRLVMSQIPFDKDAETLLPWECRGLVRSAGFEISSVSFLFLFPRLLKWLRPLEPWFARVPVGAQYQVLARRPGGEF